MTTRDAMSASGKKVEDPFSPRVLSLFLLYLQWYVPRHFHALRVAHAERFPRDAHPLIVCINHASWWDPLVILLLSRYLAPRRYAHAPMEAVALKHYGFFRKIGAFPVDNTSPRAFQQFRRQASLVLMNPEGILWMTPEGRFTDVRQRPVEWKPGIAALTRSVGDCTVVSMAIEYTFWDERLPEVLCSVGEPQFFPAGSDATTEERNQRLQAAMASAQDELTGLALKRDGGVFESVFKGKAGVSAVYDLWRRMRSAMSGKPYVAEHGAITGQESTVQK